MTVVGLLIVEIYESMIRSFSSNQSWMKVAAQKRDQPTICIGLIPFLTVERWA
uniref:Uncharacterized protein n=1 Tax=Pseudomonas marincola TaxID=437900 RepID=A0A653E6P2_9PSED